eukprot:s1995_g15.t1
MHILPSVVSAAKCGWLLVRSFGHSWGALLWTFRRHTLLGIPYLGPTCEELEAESGTGKAPTGRALEVSEMSVGFYYLLLEHRNAAAVDPERVLREHQRCTKVEAAVLDDLADCLPLGCNVAYASNPAEAQRQLRLLGNWELVLREGQEGFMGLWPCTFRILRSRGCSLYATSVPNLFGSAGPVPRVPRCLAASCRPPQ